MYQLQIKPINRFSYERGYNTWEDKIIKVKHFSTRTETVKLTNKEIKRFLQDFSNSLECHTFFLKEKGYLNFTYISTFDFINDYDNENLTEYKVKIKKIKDKSDNNRIE